MAPRHFSDIRRKSFARASKTTSFMDFSSKTVHESKVSTGVKFTVLKLTEGRRLKLRIAMADVNAKLRDLVVEEASLVGQGDASAKLQRIAIDTRDLVNDHVTPSWVRGLLESVYGLTIDGEDHPTVEQFIQDGPRELYREVAGIIQGEMGLTERESGEFVPPSTSSALADGRMSDTSAEPAAV